jgi:hypothetical protein
MGGLDSPSEADYKSTNENGVAVNEYHFLFSIPLFGVVAQFEISLAPVRCLTRKWTSLVCPGTLESRRP